MIKSAPLELLYDSPNGIADIKGESCNPVFLPWQIKASVKLLKLEVNDVYHKIGKNKVWRLSADELCDVCEEYFLKKINEIFGKS